MKIVRLTVLVVVMVGLQCTTSHDPSNIIKFSVSFTKELSDQAQDGRLLLLLANNDKSEPRTQINDGLHTQLVFGVDVEGLKSGQEIIINESAFGFPVSNTKDIPPGEYFVQALINRYETFKLKTGHTVKLPPDQGEGQQWHSKPGNFYSKPQKIKIEQKESTITPPAAASFAI